MATAVAEQQSSNFVPANAPTNSRPVFICSVAPHAFQQIVTGRNAYDEVRDKEMPPGAWLRNNKTTYRLEPADKELGYSILAVYEGYDSYNDPHDVTDNSPMRQKRKRVSPLFISESLIGDWSMSGLGAKSGFGVGIGIVRSRKPTDAELAALRYAREQNNKELVRQGEDLHREKKPVGRVHIDAAIALGLDFEWMQDYRAKKQCPRCRANIHMSSLSCEKCGVDLDIHYRKKIDLGLMTMDRLKTVDEAVWQELRESEVEQKPKSK